MEAVGAAGGVSQAHLTYSCCAMMSKAHRLPLQSCKCSGGSMCYDAYINASGPACCACCTHPRSFDAAAMTTLAGCVLPTNPTRTSTPHSHRQERIVSEPTPKAPCE